MQLRVTYLLTEAESTNEETHA